MNGRFSAPLGNFKLARITSIHEQDAFIIREDDLVGQLAWVSVSPEATFEGYHSCWATFITGIYGSDSDASGDCFFFAVKFEVL